MAEKNYRWYKVAESIAEITQRGERVMMEATIAGRDTCIAVVQDTVYAFPAKCPHAGGRLSQGFIDGGGNIVCPLHRYRYNLKSGYNTSGEGYYLKTYPVKETEDGIFVGID